MGIKARFNYITLLILALLALGINSFPIITSYLEHNFSFRYTSDNRLSMNLKDYTYLEISAEHDHWKSIRDEYGSFSQEDYNKSVNTEIDSFTKENIKIVEIAENENIKITTTLNTESNKRIKLEREYQIKNSDIINNIDIVYMQIVLGSENHSYLSEKQQLYFDKCNISIKKPNNINLEYIYHNNLLMISRIIDRETRRDGEFKINLDFDIHCE